MDLGQDQAIAQVKLRERRPAGGSKVSPCWFAVVEDAVFWVGGDSFTVTEGFLRCTGQLQLQSKPEGRHGMHPTGLCFPPPPPFFVFCLTIFFSF